MDLRSHNLKFSSRFTTELGELFEFFFPLRCISCGEPIHEVDLHRNELFCKVCKEAILVRGENFCPGCGVRYDGLTGESKCGECNTKPRPFDRVIYHFVYGGPISDAITRFKYNHNLYAGRRLTIEAIDKLKNEILRYSPEIIIPVPLHFFKYFIRAFSPTAFVSSILSEILDLPVRYDLLKKVRFTKPQVGLLRDERLKNLKGSFGFCEKKRSIIENRTILLVDDVYTTGATASLCTEILLNNGARSVILFVLARGE